MNVKQLNYSLYKAAEHLSEAGKYMMVLDVNRGLALLEEADAILSVIKPVPEKMEKAKLDTVLNEILSINLESE